MTTTIRYFQADDGMWIGFSEEVSGVNSQGETFEELMANLEEATKMVVIANQTL